MSGSAKTAQLQIRVSAEEKAAIQRAAAGAGLGLSAYVLSKVLSVPAARFRECVAACADQAARYALAELNSLLSNFLANELRDAVAAPLPPGLTAYQANYIAAMVEYACSLRHIPLPAWTRSIAPLAEPVFESNLMNLRLHLLTHSPPPFRSRNIFIDSSLGDRV